MFLNGLFHLKVQSEAPGSHLPHQAVVLQMVTTKADDILVVTILYGFHIIKKHKNLFSSW